MFVYQANRYYVPVTLAQLCIIPGIRTVPFWNKIETSTRLKTRSRHTPIAAKPRLKLYHQNNDQRILIGIINITVSWILESKFWSWSYLLLIKS